MIDTTPGVNAPLVEPPPVIDEWCSVARWDTWSSNGIAGWSSSSGPYESCPFDHSVFEGFSSLNTTVDWQCDIQDVAVFDSSKSDLTAFASLREMVETDSPELIGVITEAKLNENLAHPGIHILHRENPTHHFTRYCWDDRLFLSGGDGSHHFDAAQYIAARLSLPVPLKARLRTYTINSDAVERLVSQYAMFTVSSGPCDEYAFGLAMQRYKATYFRKSLPHPYARQNAILLPRVEARSMNVAHVLRARGFFDLGVYLRDLLVRQQRNCRRYPSP